MAHMIISTDIEPVNVQAFGNWFSFKPGQIKGMDPSLVEFLSQNKRQYGFVALPDFVAEDQKSPESVAAIAAATKEGRRNVMAELERIRYNLEVSLQKDLDIAGIKANAVTLEGGNHLATLRKLAEYKKMERAAHTHENDEVAALRGLIDGTSGTDSNAPGSGRSSLPKSTGLDK